MKVNAQTQGYVLAGKVVDADSGEKLYPSAIQIVGTTQGTTTALDAYFQFQGLAAGEYHLRISFFGYNTQDTIVVLPQDSMLVIALEPTNYDLRQVVVTANRHPGQLKDSPVLTQVITAYDIRKSQPATVQDILEREMPGIEFSRTAFGPNMSMQGIEARYILILVDGERLAGDIGTNLDYSRLSPENIQRIEIVKGAASALYGSQAMGGVINIITKNPQDGLSIESSFRLAQANQRNYSKAEQEDSEHKAKLDRPNLRHAYQLGYKKKRFEAQLFTSFETFDAYRLYDSDSLTQRFTDSTITVWRDKISYAINGQQQWQLAPKITFTPNRKWAVRLKGQYFYRKQFDFQPDHLSDHYADKAYGAHLIRYFSTNSWLEASYNSDDYNKYTYFERINEREVYYRHRLAHGRLAAFIDRGKRQNWSFGSEFFYERLATQQYIYGEYLEKSAYTAVLFFQDEIKWTERLRQTVGIRSDYHKHFHWALTPKVSLMYQTLPWIARLNYSAGFRIPTLKELYMDWDHKDIVPIKGNPDMKAEKNHYLSASLEMLRPRVNASATFYHNRIYDKIQLIWITTSQIQDTLMYTNISRQYLTGADLTARWKINKAFSLKVAYSYIHEDQNTKEADIHQLLAITPQSAMLAIDYHYRRNNYDLTIDLQGRYMGAKKDVKEYEALKNAYYYTDYEDYMIWRLTVSQQYWSAFTFSVGVNNLFDYHPPVISFNTTFTPGRRWFLSISANLSVLYANWQSRT